MADLDPLIAKLRQIREAKGISQTQLAERAGLTRSVISAAERGALGTTLHSLRCWTWVLVVELVIKEVE
jgi:predicted transcriptional regulator